MDNKNAIKGGEFIVRETLPEEIFIPEEFDDEARMIAQSCQDFLDTEVMPNLDRIDAHEEGLMPEILKKAGELGLLGISIPEEYGGFGQNFTTSMLVADTLGAGYAFSVAYSADTGIGTLPIMYYGNEEQKQKYLPGLATGELLGAYCLTEPGAGSDANSGKTKAVLNEAGTHYILNGSKMWITNGGFADILTVFAKIDDDRILSAFIVERNFPGITFGAEENKMGIKGSSTVQIFFNDCEVPVENLLGKRGDGFRIALNILNLGRIKLGANVIGASKLAINQSVQYANERKQFRTLIANFPAIKYKLANQIIKAFANETAVYRMSKNVDDAVKRNIANGMDKGTANVEAQREFVIEAALIKVFGSEMLDYVVDEGVQIHGGMGFSAETPIERGYRDSRINRIFEGTNEINRNVTGDTLIKKGLKGEIPLFEEAAKIAESLNKFPENPQFKGEYFEDVSQRLELPFELIATTGLAFLCNLISDKLCLIPTKDMKYKIIPNLWGCIISQKGTRKTPLLKAFTDMIYKKHFRHIEIYEEEKAEYEAKIKTLNAKTKALARAEAEGDTEIKRANKKETKKQISYFIGCNKRKINRYSSFQQARDFNLSR